ncbi:MAG: hypothetical protein U9N38_00580 [Thermodesulfobacteriota bacterium]|nr:hypothetical protein [Thermodesulfobacteriota bacterium]
MKFDKWKILWGAGLIFLSAFFYFVHYLIFRDPHHIFIYMAGDIAFVFIEVLLVTIIIHELLSYKDKKDRLYKLNMIIGVFFSEVGTELLKLFSGFDHNSEKMRENFSTCMGWYDKQFQTAFKTCKNYEYNIDINKKDVGELKDLLMNKRHFFVTLLQNPTLLENGTFSNLLWAVFHLTEELAYRTDITDLNAADCEHIANDMKRAYALLTTEWLVYMKHLSGNYPFLFSLAMRTNPFDPNASPEITNT